MTKNLLIRDVEVESSEWFQESLKDGAPQEKFLKEISISAELCAPETSMEPETLDEKHKFTFIDLFAGIGGFHLGMKINGGKCVFANEWEDI